MDVIENFLPAHQFKRLQKIFLGNSFPWFYNENILERDAGLDIRNYQFTHTFFHEDGRESDALFLLDPVWDLINPKEIIRAKMNLGPVDTEQREGGWHCDIEDDSITTAVLYFNTNNGYTLFKDGTKLESKENTFASFASTLEHTGVSQTDSQVRVVLNLNYIV